MIIIEPLAYRPVRPLRTLCIIALKDVVLSYAKSLPTTYGLPDALYVISPFDSLPSQCVQELIDLFAKRKQLNFTLLSLLIHTHLTSLDLTSLKENSKHLLKPRLFHILTARCQELLHLTLGMSSNLIGGKLVVQELISKNTCLRTLVLSNFSPVNDVVPSICNMYYLKTLNLSNSQFSDEGVDVLTSELNPLPEMTSLNISNTQITSRGLHMILSKFPSLCHLDLSQLSLIVPIINLEPHPLTSLVLLNTDIIPGNLYVLLQTLAKMERLELNPCQNSFIQDDWLWDVLPILTNITHFSAYKATLHLTNITFANRLVHLSLPCTQTPLSAPLFCSLFPSLQLLNLDDCTITDGTLSPGLHLSCPGLRKLSLARTTFNLTQTTVLEGEELVAFLGSFGQLRELDLSLTEIYSHNLLDLIVRTSEFGLTHLTLQSCLRLDETVIKFLECVARSCGHLCHIDIRYCFKIIQRDVVCLRDELKHANPPVPHGLSVEWV